MKVKKSLYLVSLVISLITCAYASSIDNDAHPAFKIGITERAFGSLRLSYEYTSSINNAILPVTLETGALLPVFLNSAKMNLTDISFFVRIGSGARLGKRILIPADLTMSLDRQDQAMGRFNALSYRIGITPGIQIRTRSFWGVELEWHQTAAVHIVHSDYSKARFRDRYDGETELEDGWYALTARRINIGVTHIHDTKTGFRVKLSGGVRLSPSPFNIFFEGGMFGQLPFYMDLSFHIPFVKHRSE